MTNLKNIKHGLDQMQVSIDKQDYEAAYEESLRVLHSIEVLAARIRLRSETVANLWDKQNG